MSGTGSEDEPSSGVDRSVLITGTSSGIGHATAHRFLDADWTVYATARNPAEIEDLAAEGCETPALDVTDRDRPREVIDRVVAETGSIDCLVNNAGIAKRGTIEDVPPRDVQDQFDVNLFGPHRLIRAALPHMREAGRGTIVNVSSFFGRVSTPGMGVYAGSKVALEAFSDALRGEVDPQGIDVVVIEPGPVRTNFEARTRSEMESLEPSDAYEDIYSFYDDAGRLSQAVAIDPADVAEVIHSAAETTDPDPRYPVGALAKLAVSFRFVPHPWRDRLYGLLRGLVGRS